MDNPTPYVVLKFEKKQQDPSLRLQPQGYYFYHHFAAWV